MYYRRSVKPARCSPESIDLLNSTCAEFQRLYLWFRQKNGSAGLPAKIYRATGRFKGNFDFRDSPSQPAFCGAGFFLRHFAMWFPDSTALSKAAPSVQFVALRWHELFDSFTPDSFQPRLCQLPTLVAEMGSAAKDALQTPRHNHTGPLQEELTQKLAGPVENAVCTPHQKFLLHRISTTSDAPLLYDACNHLIQEGFKQSFERTLLEKGAEQIDQAFAAKPAKSKADSWLNSWATLALDRNYLDRDDRVQFDEPLLSFSSQQLLTDLQNKLEGSKKKYDCVLEVFLTPNVVTEPRAKKRILEMVEAVMTKVVGAVAPHDLVEGDPENRVLVRREIEAVGAHVALALFARQIQPALNLLDLYRNAPTTVRIREGWIKTAQDDWKKTLVREGKLQKLHPRKLAADLTINAITERQMAGTVDSTIANALELYHVAMATEDRRVRFLTLWSAIECLAQSVDGHTTMERVSKLVAPIVVWRRMEKQLRYVAINIKFFRDATPTLKREQVMGLPNATDFDIQIEDVLETLTRPDADPRLDSLGKHCSSHSLLLWRIKSLWDIYHSAPALHKDLSSASQRLDWQLARIYRARNKLIHQGDESGLLPHLSNNLQYYFSTTISRLLHGVGTKKDNSSREAAYRWRTQFEFVMDRLSSNPAVLAIEDILPSPKRAASAPLWT